MGLGEERNDRDSPASQHALNLGEMAEARDRRPPAPGRRATARDCRQLAEEHLVDTDRKMGLELPGEEVELRRAAFHEQDFDHPVDGGRPHAGQAQDATASSSAVIPTAAARITTSLRNPSRRPGDGRTGGAAATNTPRPPPRLHVSALLRSSMTRATVFVLMPRKRPAPGCSAASDPGAPEPLSMACLSCSVSCRRIRDGAARVDVEVQVDRHTV